MQRARKRFFSDEDIKVIGREHRRGNDLLHGVFEVRKVGG